MAQQLCHPLQSQTFLSHHLSRFLVRWALDLTLLRFPAGYQDVRAIGLCAGSDRQ